MPELRFRRDPVRMHVEREGQLEDPLALLPVDTELDVELGRAGAQGDALLDGRGTEPAHRHDRRRHGADVDPPLVDIEQLGHRPAVVRIEVPRVPQARQVTVQAQDVGGAVGRDRFPTVGVRTQ